MKSNALPARWFAWQLKVVCLISAALLAGCGVGFGTDGSAISAGVGTGGTGVFKASLASSAADGYLINAIIFLDKNGNYQLDSGEPFAATDVNGNCSLAVLPVEVGAYPVVALAIKGVTIDSTTMQALASNYVLSFPKESINSQNNNLISPLSSHLRELMETGKYSTTQQALDVLVAQMGLPQGTDILNDTIASTNTTVQATAKSMAELMAKQMDGLLSTAQTLDIERYRVMMALIESNMKIVAQLNTPENLENLSNSITIILSGFPTQATKAEVVKGTSQ
jgi:hypothetical protein